MEPNKPKAGLILTGGGARAAYQVGVLKAVRELLRQPERNPFPIVCGTSAGAINAATLSVFADNFDAGVGHLLGRRGCLSGGLRLLLDFGGLGVYGLNAGLSARINVLDILGIFGGQIVSGKSGDWPHWNGFSP